jgi:creatinine amidohydrolase/Fe(II)-dependent formamide hydrolase-like protein
VRYELMLPHQIRTAIDGRWPVVLPLGVLEYHGEHMAVGMDTLAVTGILEILESEADLVVLPPFYYGAASYAVAPPERTGTLHVDAEALMPVAKAMFTGLLRIGFRNIHLVIHHQTENFTAGMPTDLAFKLAAREAIFAFLEAERGEGWWGAESMAGYTSSTRPAPIRSTGSRRTLSCRLRLWRATHSITPVRVRPRCLWRSYRKASTSRVSQRTNGIPGPPVKRASNLG